MFLLRVVASFLIFGSDSLAAGFTQPHESEGLYCFGDFKSMRTTYRDLALNLHPDKNEGASHEAMVSLNNQFHGAASLCIDPSGFNDAWTEWLEARTNGPSPRGSSNTRTDSLGTRESDHSGPRDEYPHVNRITEGEPVMYSDQDFEDVLSRLWDLAILNYKLGRGNIHLELGMTFKSYMLFSCTPNNKTPGVTSFALEIRSGGCDPPADFSKCDQNFEVSLGINNELRIRPWSLLRKVPPNETTGAEKKPVYFADVKRGDTLYRIFMTSDGIWVVSHPQGHPDFRPQLLFSVAFPKRKPTSN